MAVSVTERPVALPPPEHRGAWLTDLQKQIELLEAQGSEAELLGELACDPATRAHNRQLADELSKFAQMLRREARAQAA